MRSAFKHCLAEKVGNIIFQGADLHYLAQITNQLLFGKALILYHCRNGLQSGWFGGGFGGHERYSLDEMVG
jgi:hypothetical protein